MSLTVRRRHWFAAWLLAAALPPASAHAQSAIVRASCSLVQDTLIRQRTPTLSYNTYPKGWAHSAVENIAGSWIETLLEFDVTSCLPVNARVLEASLTLHVTNASTYTFELYELLRTFSGTATWHIPARDAAAWTQAGAMGAGNDYGARVGTIGPAGIGQLTVPLIASVVQRWTGGTSASIVVRPTGTPGTNFAPVGLGFQSKEHSSGQPPALDVAYTLPATSSFARRMDSSATSAQQRRPVVR